MKNKNLTTELHVHIFKSKASKTILSGMVMMMLTLTSMMAQRIVSGTVTGDDGEPLLGVSVTVDETTRGTITDLDGKFQISASPDDILQFNFLGYEEQRYEVGNATVIDINLSSSAELIDEIVVVGYGTQKKSHLTGSVSRVENKKLDQIAVSRVDEALIGQVSGVNIAQTNGSEAGAAPTITVRGVGSVAADIGPAVVVDGLVVDSDFLSNLDMNDVASFEILKDAASAAIYGSEGSNGVILITTKSGEEGKTKFNYSGYVGQREAHGSESYRKDVEEWAAFEMAETGTLTEETQYALLLVETLGVNRDWQDVLFDGGLTHSHSLSARGGTDKTKFSVALRYLKDEGVIVFDDYELFSANFKLDTKLSDRLSFQLTMNPSHSNRRRVPTSIHNTLRQSPWLPVFHTEESLQFIDRESYPDVGVGDYFWEDHLIELDLDGDGDDARPRTTSNANPLGQNAERNQVEGNTKLLTRGKFKYKLADGLTVSTSVGVTREERRRERYDGVLWHHTLADRAEYNLQNRLSTRIINDNLINYTTTVNNDHEIGALLGLTLQHRNIKNSDIVGSGFTNDLLPNLQGATQIDEFLELETERNKIGYFGRVNYAYQDKYLVSASLRRDASSVFGPENKWGTFPALSVGWNLAREDFVNDDGAISSLKFRFSFGLTGNENFRTGSTFTDFFPFLALLQSANTVLGGTVQTGFAPENIANESLRWEGNREINPGLDFGFWGNRLTGSLDWYERTSNDLLLNNPVSNGTGFSTGILNIGEVKNTGVELELRSVNFTKGDFQWSTQLIATTNQNELTEFGDSNGQLIEDFSGRGSLWINEIGNPISSFYGFVLDESREIPRDFWDTPWNRIGGASEDVIVLDLNGDGIITAADQTILGDPYPDLVWSVTNQFQFGSVDFSFMWTGSHGAEVRDLGEELFENQFNGATENVPGILETGLISHPSFIQKRSITSDPIRDASFISLRNVNLGVNLNSAIPNLRDKMGINNVRLYVSGQNILYIFADDYKGFNPEFVDNNQRQVNAFGAQRGGSPIARTFTFGLNFDF